MGAALKFLRSHFFLSVVVSLIALTMIMMQTVYGYTHSIPMWYISEMCFIGLLLFVIDRDETPEFKTMWLAILFVLRFPGVILYILCTSVRQDRKFFRRYNDAAAEIRADFPKGAQDAPPEPCDPTAAVQLQYLSAATRSAWAGNERIKYYPSGEAFHAAFLESLEQAEHFIFLEYFIVEDGQMWGAIHDILRRKAVQGVTVCVMYDDLGCMSTLPGNYVGALEREGIHAIRANRVPLLALSRLNNNRDHRKIAVIDGTTGFTGGINLADEYINAREKYGHWKDTAIQITGAGVTHLTALFLNLWNCQSKFHLEPRDYLTRLPRQENGDGGIIFPYGTGPRPLYQESIGRNVYLNMINGAQRYCYITTPYLICDYEILGALRLAAKKGVDVRIITPHIPDRKLIFWMTRSNYAPLLADGVKIYEYTPGFIHAKTMVSDDKFSVCGTINMDYRSLDHHFENAVWMYRTPCVLDMKADFLHTQGKTEKITPELAKMPITEKITADVIKLFAPLL